MTDTVGFILKLPHHLVDAFRSTLEEARYADMLVHVVDASNPDRDLQMKVVYETLSELHISGKPILTTWNRFDILPAGEVLRDPRVDQNVRFSAKTGDGKQQVFGCNSEAFGRKPYTSCGGDSLYREWEAFLDPAIRAITERGIRSGRYSCRGLRSVCMRRTKGGYLVCERYARLFWRSLL